MNRLLSTAIVKQFKQYRQMVVLLGPRQSGKTWIAKNLGLATKYLSWDNSRDRRLILENGPALVDQLGLQILGDEKPVVVFDELHKFARWKDF